MKTSKLFAILASIIVLFWFGCSDDSGSPSKPSNEGSVSGGAVTLQIMAGSESKLIEPIIQSCARKNNLRVKMHYSGSVDMMLALKNKNFAYDAVLPASSIWLRLGDQEFRRIKEEASIMRSPVGLGIKKSLARDLGWIDKDVNVQQILDAVQAGRIQFAMTSATQSNSGFSSYMGMLMALAGKPDVLTEQHLQQPGLQEKIKNLLGGVSRGSGSSGWLMHTFVDDYDRLDAMFNYESMIIEANRQLVAANKDPLYIVYPVDGLAVADSTLGFVNKPERPDNQAKLEAFKRLRDCLLSDKSQKQILGTGFRAGLIGMNPDSAPKTIYNPDWGIDLARTISPIVWPDAKVTYHALTLYQTAFRKPSMTAFAIDCSGSMKGKGLQDLKVALTNLFDTRRASRYLIQTGQKDITIVIPFDNRFLWQAPLVIEGNDPADLDRTIQAIQALETRGGTNIYNPVALAWKTFGSYGDRLYDYLPSVILMTDGHSNKGSFSELMQFWRQLQAPFDLPPVFCIMYGNASDEQLKEIAQATSGRVFDGRKAGGLEKAFRSAKGYN
ncbi:VWA domain-containing protein [uncultured Desulfosarcina sp.]|uniref:vWA domain-containing protein n=1 Tax=uncultured Desulfosarcina sp. TaxID=218289 RepID=UPI0029C6107B|nr:VWA domain-containing protein [uncultured Desulfosarcina sp.]